MDFMKAWSGSFMNFMIKVSQLHNLSPGQNFMDFIKAQSISFMDFIIKARSIVIACLFANPQGCVSSKRLFINQSRLGK